jgi:hypothetical protein
MVEGWWGREREGGISSGCSSLNLSMEEARLRSGIGGESGHTYRRLGNRFAEETDVKPKPMIEVGGKPIIWHIMKIYSAHGIDNFIVCLGCYRGYIIKQQHRGS